MDQNKFDLLKSHIDAYTRKDGSFVQAHDDKRVAATFNGNAVSEKHGDKMLRKEPEWKKNGRQNEKIPHSDVAGAPEFSHKEVYGHDGHTSPAGSDFSKEFAAKAPQHFVLRHADGARSFVNTEGSAYARYHAPVDSEKADGKTGSAAPQTKSKNEDWGFHGEAVKEHLKSKLGPENYYANATERDHTDARAAAAKKFSDTAHKLVEAGHFSSHDQARDYLDATHGRHLHDAAPDGNVTKVPWLAKDVKSYKAKNGIKDQDTKKTGSAAPAKTVNLGTAKYPMHTKTSEKLPEKRADGSTHHVGGFVPPTGAKGDDTIHHEGRAYSYNHKSGQNIKTGEKSYEYANKDDGDRRVWVTHSGHLMND